MIRSVKIGVAISATALLIACATTDSEKTTASNIKADATNSEPSEKTEDTKTADASKKICRRQAITGSRFKKKICHTQDEWDKIKENAIKTSDGLVNQTTINDGTSGQN